MNLRTQIDMFIFNFHPNCQTHKEDGKDYTIVAFCNLLITDQHRFLYEVKLGGKHQDHLLKGKDKGITRKEDGLIPIYRNQNALTKKIKEILMNRHLVEKVKTRRHDSTMEILDM
jgi:hypothetical protein